MTKSNEEQWTEYMKMQQESKLEGDYRITYLRSIMDVKGYKSIKKLAEASNIPITTLHEVFKRGIESTSVKILIGICNTLEISLDFVVGNFDTEYAPQQIKDNHLSNMKTMEQNLIENERDILIRKANLVNRELAINEKEVNVLKKEHELIKMQMGMLRVKEGKY